MARKPHKIFRKPSFLKHFGLGSLKKEKSEKVLQKQDEIILADIVHVRKNSRDSPDLNKVL